MPFLVRTVDDERGSITTPGGKKIQDLGGGRFISKIHDLPEGSSELCMLPGQHVDGGRGNPSHGGKTQGDYGT